MRTLDLGEAIRRGDSALVTRGRILLKGCRVQISTGKE